MRLLLALFVLTTPAEGWEGDVVIPFAATPRIERFAKRATAGATSDEQRATRLYDAIVALKQRGAIAADRDNRPKDREPKTADALLAIAQGEAKGNAQAGCYELSALLVAAARAVGLDAVGIERDDVVGTGQIGHVMAAIRLSDGAALQVFDLQNEVRASNGPYVVLDDAGFIAHHYNHRSIHLYLQRRYAEALTEIDRALLLGPQMASLRNNRATVLLALGEPVLAAAEAMRAVEQRPRVPLYLYQLGHALLLCGDLDSAQLALTSALELDPTYELARRDLDRIHSRRW